MNTIDGQTTAQFMKAQTALLKTASARLDAVNKIQDAVVNYAKAAGGDPDQILEAIGPELNIAIRERDHDLNAAAELAGRLLATKTLLPTPSERRWLKSVAYDMDLYTNADMGEHFDDGINRLNSTVTGERLAQIFRSDFVELLQVDAQLRGLDAYQSKLGRLGKVDGLATAQTLDRHIRDATARLEEKISEPLRKIRSFVSEDGAEFLELGTLIHHLDLSTAAKERLQEALVGNPQY